MSDVEKKQTRAVKAQEQTDKLKAQKDRETQSNTEWDQTFENSRDALAKLAAKARKEYKEGHTEELDPDNL